jgi:hypothetical protein
MRGLEFMGLFGLDRLSLRGKEELLLHGHFLLITIPTLANARGFLRIAYIQRPRSWNHQTQIYRLLVSKRLRCVVTTCICSAVITHYPSAS